MPSPAGKGDREAVDEENYLLPPSGREGDHEVVEGAGGYESSGLSCMRCLPLFSLVEAEVSSLLCAFSFRHPCGAGRWGKATAPCSHPGGSHSDSHRRADMEFYPAEKGETAGGAMPFAANGIAPPLPVAKKPTEGQLSMPSPAGKGDRDAGDEENYLLPPSGMGARSPRAQKQSKRHCNGRIWNPPLRKQDNTRAFSTYPKTTLSLRRKAKLHTAGTSLAASGKFHSPQANFTVQPAAGRGCTTGDHEAVEGARGRKSKAGASHGGDTRERRKQEWFICGRTGVQRRTFSFRAWYFPLYFAGFRWGFSSKPVHFLVLVDFRRRQYRCFLRLRACHGHM